jgi:serine/threonine protein kinase
MQPEEDPQRFEHTETDTRFSVAAAFSTSSSRTQTVGEIPRYEKIRELGRGAMGEVWLMRDSYLRRKVASKQLLPEFTAPGVQQQFLNEAQITARLEHPGIVPVYTLEISPEGQISYAMKVVRGNTLKQEIQRLKDHPEATRKYPIWRQELDGLLHIFLKVCDALEYAHSKGIVHRDLKPANIMIGPFHEVYVLDWGIAQDLNSPQAQVHPDDKKVIAGTPRYLSPEQARCRQLTPASDQYTLGLILQEILTGAPAFQAKSMPEMLKKILKGERAPSTTAGQHRIPMELQQIIARAVALRAEQRYPSVAAMADDLRAWMQDQETQVYPDNTVRAALRQIRHHPQTALLISLLLLLVCSAGVAGSLVIWQRTQLEMQRRQSILEKLNLEMVVTGQTLDSYLGHLESQLEYLAGAASESWLRGLPVAPPTGPSEWNGPVWLPRPQTELARLHSLAPVFQRVFAVAAERQAIPARWLKTRQPKSPLLWAGVHFDNHVSLLYPGQTRTAPAIEAQIQALIQRLPTSEQTQPLWSDRLTLPDGRQAFVILQYLRDDTQRKLGYAFLMVRQEAMEQALASGPLKTGRIGLEVLNQQGQRVIGQSGHSPHPESVLNQLRQGQHGLQETTQGLYLYQSLVSANWRLLAQVDFKSLLEKTSHD